MTLTPAYGRDYRRKADILADWNAGKDFVLNLFTGESTYFNRESAAEDGARSYQVRYLRNTRVAVLQRTAKGWRI